MVREIVSEKIKKIAKELYYPYSNRGINYWKKRY